MANTVKSRVVEISRQGVDTTLEDYLSLHTYPVETFMTGSTDLKTAVATGIIYLKSVGTGAVIVSKSEEREFLSARVKTNPDNTVSVNYIAKNYRFPINEEKVPILDVSWGVGDIILNTDYTQNQCMGWVCKESGVPGVWNQFGNIGPYYNYIEELDYLPEPSVLQLGRQVRYKLNGKQGLFICRWDGANPVWAQQDYLIGTEDERPESAPNGTWYYNTTVDRYEWYSEKDAKWYRFEQMESEFAEWSNRVDETIALVKAQAEEEIGKATEELKSSLNSRVDEIIASSQNRIDEILQSCIEATNNANNAAQTVETLEEEINKMVAESVTIWKPDVPTYDDLVTTYPNPEHGWTVSVDDTGYIYRYDSTSGSWIKVMETPTGLLNKSEAMGLFQKKEEYISTSLTTTWPNTAILSSDATADDFIEVFLDPTATEGIEAEYSDLGLVATLTDARTITFTYTETVNTQEIPIIIRISRV